MKYKILFVCMGNICRSPSAQVIFENLLREVRVEHSCQVDSAGTHDFNIGKVPDVRAQAVASKHGLRMDHLRARQVTCDDFYEFDFILAMDQHNLDALTTMVPNGMQGKIQLLTRYASGLYRNQPIPDPYYGGSRGFDTLYGILDGACQGLLKHLGETVLHMHTGRASA